MRLVLLWGLLIGLVFGSCGPNDVEILQEDTEEIVSYLEENGILDEALVTTTGMYYIIHAPGNSSVRPGQNSLVTCNYKGYFPDGEVFDEAEDIDFVLGNTIQGWRQGIPLIGEGGSIQLFIPSYLGYGRQGTSGIPKNQVLIFDVDLLKVK